mmetsp:Transcript_6498/g.26791  ORF Transcript_6498/g.26791 Transcript_6498/m.26791 type:complete len:202 (-) Transcript_6498:1472-2077(-)
MRMRSVRRTRVCSTSAESWSVTGTWTAWRKRLRRVCRMPDTCTSPRSPAALHFLAMSSLKSLSVVLPHLRQMETTLHRRGGGGGRSSTAGSRPRFSTPMPLWSSTPLCCVAFSLLSLCPRPSQPSARCTSSTSPSSSRSSLSLSTRGDCLAACRAASTMHSSCPPYSLTREPSTSSASSARTATLSTTCCCSSRSATLPST